MEIKKIFDTKLLLNIYLYVAVFFIVFKESRYLTKFGQILKWLTVIIGIFVITTKILKKEVKYKKNHLLFATIFIFNCFSTLLSPIGITANSILTLSVRSIMIICLYLFNDSDEFENLLYLYFILVTITSVVGVTKEYMDVGIISWRDYRYRGIFYNENYLGMVSLFSIIIGCYFVKKNRKILDVVFLLFNVIALFMSSCRTAILALFLVFFIDYFKKYKKVIFMMFCLILMIIVIFLIVNYDVIISDSLIRSELSNYEKFIDKLSSARYISWKECLTIYLKNPILGYGVGNIKDVCQANKEIAATMVSKLHSSSHNLFVDILFESGIIGFMLFVGFIISKLKLLYNSLDKEIVATIFIIAALINSMLDCNICSYLYPVSFFFWLSLRRIEKYSD